MATDDAASTQVLTLTGGALLLVGMVVVATAPSSAAPARGPAADAAPSDLSSLAALDVCPQRLAAPGGLLRCPAGTEAFFWPHQYWLPDPANPQHCAQICSSPGMSRTFPIGGTAEVARFAAGLCCARGYNAHLFSRVEHQPFAAGAAQGSKLVTMHIFGSGPFAERPQPR
ncbi:hypothetical protein KFE25_003374 [Diacronema lutheri]|uniref:Uncharacterized protein n=2 Tax=Diacronema lutheri TaxID=2081491 RepID=A0A8J5XFS1_DIALT|nr:hypothetical protein KFE25_003374 [Diacronema lutheri]